MTSTMLTTWTQLFKELFEQISCDPNHDIDLTDEQREELDTAARNYFKAEVDKVLAPYGAFIIGNGEIILSDIADDTVAEWPEYGSPEWDDLKEELGMISFETFEHPLY